jgi:hypothetical protein
MSFPRPFAGANSPTSARDVGTSAPTATHDRIHRERDQEHADRVDEQVPLVDALAAELVAEPPADERADRAADGVRPDRRERTHPELAESQLGLEQREARAQRHDRAGVEVGRHRGEHGPLPLLLADRALVPAGFDPHGIGCGHDLSSSSSTALHARSRLDNRRLKRIKAAG